MSLLSMFTRKKSSEDEASPPSSGLINHVPTGPSPRAAAEPAMPSRRTERSARRELLFTVVRDCMNRAGVLSASYKFKVLSLDSRGREFLVMVDLCGTQLTSHERLAEIEAMVAQAAKARHAIGVRAVYWRQNDHVAVGLAVAAPGETPAKAAPALRPAKASAAVEVKTTAAAEAKVAEPERPEPVQASLAGYEPIGVEEMTAFRQALASGSKPPKVHGPQSYTLLTGFENTEIHEEPPQVLSSSQYGELR